MTIDTQILTALRATGESGIAGTELSQKLGISQRTVEIHRAHIMHKLGAKNSVDLARKVIRQERRA